LLAQEYLSFIKNGTLRPIHKFDDRVDDAFLGIQKKISLFGKFGDKKPPIGVKSTVEYVPSRAVKVSFDKAWLADENDVERYLESMREALLDEIRKGKRIQI